MERVICWLIKRLVNLHYKRTHFYAWSWGIDENTDINILSEESYHDKHRYGTKETVYNASQRIQDVESVESVEADTPQTDLLVTEYPQKGEVNLIGRDETEAVVMAYDVYKELTEPQTDCGWK